MSKQNWLIRLKDRWKLKSVGQTILVLLVFALTGTTIVLVKKPILEWVFGQEIPVWFYFIYYILILPIYNLVLLIFAFLLGQFQFFWQFEKRMWQRIVGKKPVNED